MDIADRPIDDFIVQGARPAGPSLGRFGDQDIPETIVDMFGRRYSFVSVAPRGWTGDLDIDALKPGEFILLPGLIYRMDVDRTERPLWFSALWP